MHSTNRQCTFRCMQQHGRGHGLPAAATLPLFTPVLHCLLHRQWMACTHPPDLLFYRLKPFHVKLMGARRSPWGLNSSDSHLEAELQQKGIFQDLHSLCEQADIIVLTCSLTDATRGMVDQAFLRACKPGVRIINVARGGRRVDCALLVHYHGLLVQIASICLCLQRPTVFEGCCSSCMRLHDQTLKLQARGQVALRFSLNRSHTVTAK